MLSQFEMYVVRLIGKERLTRDQIRERHNRHVAGGGAIPPHGPRGAAVAIDYALDKLCTDFILVLDPHSKAYGVLHEKVILHAPKYELTAKEVPYSSVVGGGLQLRDKTGRTRFIVNFIGTTEGITKEETEDLSRQFEWFINELGLDVRERP